MAIRKIEKRVLPSGKVVYRAPYLDGSGARRSQNFPTAKEAKAFLQKTSSELVQGVHTPASVSPLVKEAASMWITQSERNGLEATTLKQYREHVDLHINPFIGGTKLSQLTTAAAINSFIDRLYEEERSPQMIAKVIVSLGAIFREARRRGLAVMIPTKDLNLNLPKRDDPRPVIPTKAELQAIIAGAKGRWRALILTAVFAGLRASELRGLFWSDVDLDAGLINVQRRADASHKIGKLKSKSGYRAIQMPPIVISALREWKLACPKGEIDLVFSNGVGKVESYANIMEHGFAPIQIAAGITRLVAVTDDDGKPVINNAGKPVMREVARYAMHALRHACASLWIEEGHNPKRIQTLMGHSSITLTFDTYGHLFADVEADQRAAESVQVRLLGKVR
jgi:integrase